MTAKRYDEILASMPIGLEWSVLRVLREHVGRENAIGREMLVAKARVGGTTAHERAIRETVKGLRRQGHLICSAPGENGGYYLAKDREEFEEFMKEELEAKIKDMSETVREMRKAADVEFGLGLQLSLL